MMPGALYDALREAGSSNDKARAAAEEVATVTVDTSRFDTRLTRLEWMVTTVVGLQIATIAMLLGYALNYMAH